MVASRSVLLCLTAVLFLVPCPALATGQISGSVVCGDTGAPLPCEVEVLEVGGGWITSGFCGVDGTYVLSDLEAGEYHLLASVMDQPEYYELFYDGTIYLDQATPVTVVDGQDTSNIDFTMWVGGSVSGRVVAEVTGEPIAELWVVVFTPDWEVAKSAATDADGNYEILGLPPESYLCEAYDDTDEYLLQYWDHVNFEDEATLLVFEGTEIFTDIDFSLVVGATISGTVVDQDGAPVVGAYAEAHNDPWTRSHYAVTDASGRFAINGLYPDSYLIYASAEDYGLAYYVDENGIPISITVGAGEVRTGVQVVLNLGGTISGRLLRAADDSPVAYGYVWAWRPVDFEGASADCDENGNFSVGGLPAGTYRLWGEGDEGENLVPQVYSDDNGNPIEFDVVVGEEIPGIVMRLVQGAVVTGTVSSAVDGEPVAGVYVTANEIDGYGYRDTDTAADGSYALAGLSDTEHLVTARHPDFLEQTYLGALFESNGTPIQVAAGETLGDVDFSLEAAGRISGTVVDITGAPINDVNVEAYFDEDIYIPGAFTETSADGSFDLGSVVAGETVYVVAYDWLGRYAWQWYDGAALFFNATPVPVLVGQTTAGVDFVLEVPGVISVNETALAFSGQTYGDDIPAQSILVSNAGPGPAAVDLWVESDWLCLDLDWDAVIMEAGGALPVEVSAWTWGLNPGTYSDRIHIYDHLTGFELLVDVSVTLTESAPVFDFDPWELYFDGEVGGADPASQGLWLANWGGGTVTFTVSSVPTWLEVSPGSGSLSRGGDATELSVSPRISGLAEGDYEGAITLTTSVGLQEVDAYLYMAPAPEGEPEIVAPDTIIIQIPGGLPPEQAKALAQTTFEISNNGDGTLYWNLREQDTWIDADPASGSIPPGGAPVSVTLSADPSVLFNGMNSTYMEIGSSRDQAGVEVGVQVGAAEVDLNAQVEETEKGHLVVPVLAHVDGVGESRFASDLWIANRPSGRNVEVKLFFVPAGADGSREAVSTTLALASGQTVSLLDVMDNWLGGRIPKGALIIQGEDIEDIETNSKTYSGDDTATFGQEIPAVTWRDGVSRLEGRLYIPGLAQSADPSTGFRSNLLLTEVGGTAVHARVQLLDHLGALLGEVADVEVPPFSTVQINQVFGAAGYGGEARGARAEVEVWDGDGRVVAMGSTVDNMTHDPTTLVGVVKNSSVGTTYIPVVASASGVNDTVWVSDVMIANVDSAARQVVASYFDKDGVAVGTVSQTVQPGHTWVLDDVVGTTFDATSSRGSLKIVGDPVGGLAITSRTYNMSENGTYGQGIPAVAVTEALQAGGGTVRLIGLNSTERFRTNVGVTEVLGAQVTVGVVLRDHTGEQVLGYREVTLDPYGQFQANIFEAMGLGGTNIYAATAVVQVVSGDGAVIVYGSTVDNTTGDGTTIPSPRRVETGPTTPSGGGGRP